MKHTEIPYYFAKQMIQAGHVQVKNLRTNEMPAGCDQKARFHNA
jgi:hypothetical protein